MIQANLLHLSDNSSEEVSEPYDNREAEEAPSPAVFESLPSS